MFFSKRHVSLIVRAGTISAENLESGLSVTRTCKALIHPRMLMGDFFGVEKCMNEIMSEVAPKKFLIPGPTVFIQLLDKIDGGVTNVEARAFRESVIAAGAVEVHVPKTEKPLSKSVLLEKKFESWDDNA